MSKVSIVVPCYKVEAYLPQCIESLQAQTLEDIEIILVDDGSPDRCGEICDAYAEKDARIKVLHKANGGVSAARNDGMALATGEYILFADSDDWLEIDGCEIMYQTGIQQDADVVIADIYTVAADGNKKYSKLFFEEFTAETEEVKEQVMASVLYQFASDLAPKQWQAGYGGPWNKMVRRSSLLDWKVQFEPRLKGIFDDRLFALSLYCRAKRISYVSKPVYDYRAVDNSMTKSYKPNMMQINEEIFKAFSALIEGCNYSGEVLKKAYAAFVIYSCLNAIRLFILNPQNQMTSAEKKKLLREIIHSEPYSSAAFMVDKRRLLRNTRMIALGIQLHSANLIYMTYQGKMMLNRIR